MDIRKIKKLIEMLQESDLKEIEVSQGDESVRILRDRFVQANVNNIVQQPEIFSSDTETQQKYESKNNIMCTYECNLNIEKILLNQT